MKKLSVLMVLLFGAASLSAGSGLSGSDFSLSASVKYSSEYVFRGRRAGFKVLASRVEAGCPVFDECNLYVGADFALPIQKSAAFLFGDYHASPYVGISYDITDVFALDFGYIHRFYTDYPTRVYNNETNGGIPSFMKRDMSEAYVGISANMMLSPALYLFYNFDQRGIVIEGSIGHSYDLSPHSVEGLSFDLGLKVGYNRTEKVFGHEMHTLGSPHYVYFNANADIVYSVSENAKAKVGVACAANSAKRDSWVRGSEPNKFIWFNATVDCSF
ncbi:MAG: hypothetical protein LBR91_03440 [Puniceicoccales bacterium]|jgi:hypothetical protein|nr:hypothetical protein [Puniceicoccales bacterium]